MTGTTAAIKPEAERAQISEHPVDSARFDWAVAGLSIWLIGGLYLDGWAHTHGKVDDVFLTPWHAVLYTGVQIMFVFLVFHQSRNMSNGYAWRSALPKGYLLSLVGAALFLLGGLLDFFWHTVFGLEVNLETLLSPTHLLLATSGVLVISGPMRAAWFRLPPGEAQGWKVRGPVVLSATLILSVLTFFTQFAHPINASVTETVMTIDPARISDLYVMNADGTDQMRLTASPDGYARYGAWSPDGRQVVFTQGEATEDINPESALYLMNTAGSGSRQLTDMPGQEYAAAWSPDGTRIVFVSRVGQKEAIYVIHADGNNLQKLTDPAAAMFGPAWSPDGSRIAYTSNAVGSDQIYMMNVDGLNPTQLTSKGTHNWGAAWSPDGNQIAFASSRDTGLDIYVITPDGYNETRLTKTPNDDYAPAWSPDGRQMAFVTWHDGTADIYRMNADGGDVRNLTHSHALELNFPKWSPDGQTILFSANGHSALPNLSDTQRLAIASILLQSALLMGAVLLLVRRWTLPFGALTVMFTVNGLLMSIFNDHYIRALPMLGAGLIADILLRRLRPSAGRRARFLLFAFVVPVVLYALYFFALHMTTGIEWTIHLWLGSIFMAGIIGLFLGILTTPILSAVRADT